MAKFKLAAEFMRNKTTGITHQKVEQDNNIYLVPQTAAFARLSADMYPKVLEPITSAKQVKDYEVINNETILA